MTSFQQPIGPKADLAELEFIAALHQTCFPDLRKDCSISSADVLLFLRSRYGLKLDQDRAFDIILGLGGKMPDKVLSAAEVTDEEENIALEQDNSEHVENEYRDHYNPFSSSASSILSSPQGDSEKYLDLVQWVSVLLIPTFIKANQESIYDRDRLNSEIVRVQREIDSKGDTINIFDALESVWKQQQLKRELGSLREKQSLLVDHCLVENVRRALVDFIQEGQTQPLLLNENFVKALLREYGEDASANDSELVAQMVECATIPGNLLNDTVIFDAHAFAAALTSDVLLWECGIEDKLSTPFFDVHGFDPLSPLCHPNVLLGESEDGQERHAPITGDQQVGDTFVIEDHVSDEVPESSDNEESYDWNILSTGPSIDSVVDTHQSILFLMAVWAYFIFSVSVYMTFINATNYDIFDCGQGFECILVNRIWTWFSLGLLLTVGGMIIMIPISLANDPYRFTWQSAVVSASALLMFTIVPHAFIESFKGDVPHGDDGQYTNLDRIVSSKWFQVAIDTYLAYGLVLLIFIPKHVISHHCSLDDQRSPGIIGRRFLSSDLIRSAGTKRAATRKINSLLDNAKTLHLECKDQGGRQSVMARYLIHEDNYQDAGGVIWSFVMLLSNRLVEEHGVWIHSTLAVAQEGQILVFIFLITILMYETNIMAEYAEATIADVEASEISFATDLILWYIPRGAVIRKSSYVGISFAIGVGIVLIVLYLPSTVSTILKLRCGALTSINDKHFAKYRWSADTTYYNLGELYL